MGKFMIVQVFTGYTSHIRSTAKRHSLKYPLFFLQLSSNGQEKKYRFFGLECRGLFSLYAKDYLDGGATNLNQGLKEFLLKHDIHLNYDHFILQSAPRVLGFHFNPVSFWYLLDNSENLLAVLVEVNNTFGERHFYFLDRKTLEENSTVKKQFHVSPFFSTTGFYKFSFFREKSRCKIDINYYNNENELLLSTYLFGKPVRMSSNIFLKMFFHYGWLSAMVVFRIHFNALLLLMKGISFYKKPNQLQPNLSKGNSHE